MRSGQPHCPVISACAGKETTLGLKCQPPPKVLPNRGQGYLPSVQSISSHSAFPSEEHLGFLGGLLLRNLPQRKDRATAEQDRGANSVQESPLALRRALAGLSCNADGLCCSSAKIQKQSYHQPGSSHRTAEKEEVKTLVFPLCLHMDVEIQGPKQNWNIKAWNMQVLLLQLSWTHPCAELADT